MRRVHADIKRVPMLREARLGNGFFLVASSKNETEKYQNCEIDPEGGVSRALTGALALSAA